MEVFFKAKTTDNAANGVPAFMNLLSGINSSSFNHNFNDIAAVLELKKILSHTICLSDNRLKNCYLIL